MKGKHKRMIELAGRIKEVGSGNMEKLEEIIARFVAYVGVSDDVAQSYLNTFIKAKLVIVQHGQEIWKYSSEPEQEMFGITI